ncbi:MAG TPA: endonuclease III [Gemmatimonadaceae bacterium]
MARTHRPAKPSPARATRPVRRRPRGASRRQHVLEIVARLKREYPDAHCELDHRNPYELLAATILSAQSTDRRVNMVTPALFSRYPTPAALAEADVATVEDLVRSTGFFRAKTRSLLGMARGIVERHGGAVPSSMEHLTALPGVGRKTANVVLGNAFGLNEGIVVDTHVKRLVVRLGLTDETDPEKIEQVLMPLVPREDWTILSHLLIFHGRRVCVARLPRCGECVLNNICPSARV